MARYRFVYTDHMEFQLFNRSISRSQVEQTVLAPDGVGRDVRDPALTVASREYTAGTVLKVWYRLEHGEAQLVSCILVTARRERPDAPKKPTKTKRKGRR